MLGGYFHRSLRRRVALALAGTSVLGYILVAVALYVIQRARSTGGCFTPGLFSGAECVNPYSNPIEPMLLILLVLLALVLAGWACWILAGGLLRQLSAAADTVRQLGPQNLGQRIRMTGAADPLRNLGDAIDEALDRMAAGYEGQRRFAANASHELRTPLAVQRLLTEVALDDPAAGDDLRLLGAHLLRTNERNERLIEGLLVLAEADRGLPGMIPVRLDQLARSVADAHQELAARHQVSLRPVLTRRLVSGDALLLERLVSNLVANAIQYNKPGGWAEIEVARDPRPALIVRNTGDIIPAEDLPALFEPFRRLSAARTNHGGGAGLGLSIVRSITTAHGGMVRAEPRPEGGLLIEIDLPSPVDPEHQASIKEDR